MNRNLRDLFEHEFHADPPPPLGDVVQTAVVHGRRLRRRHTVLSVGGAAVGIIAAAASTVALIVPTWTDGNTPVSSVAAPAISDGDRIPRSEWCLPTPGADGYGRDVLVVLGPGVSDAQRYDLETVVRSNPLVLAGAPESREQAYARFKKEWEVRPESFRVRLKDPATHQDFVRQVKEHEGILGVARETSPTVCLPVLRSGD